MWKSKWEWQVPIEIREIGNKFFMERVCVEISLSDFKVNIFANTDTICPGVKLSILH